MPSRASSRLALATVTGLALVLSGCAVVRHPPPMPPPPRTTSRTPAHHHGDDAPQRVVTLEPLELDTAVAVGITPVGTAVANMVNGVPSYLGVEGVASVGTVSEPDLEAIAALQPDLILGTESATPPSTTSSVRSPRRFSSPRRRTPGATTRHSSARPSAAKTR